MGHIEDRTSLVFRPSPGKAVGLLVLTAVMVAVCWFAARIADPLHAAICWFGVFFFSLGFIAIPWQHFKGDSVIRIGPDGIEDRRSRMSLFAWHDIRAIRVLDIHSQKFLILRVANLEQHAAHLGPGAQRLRGWTYRLARFAGMDEDEHALAFSGLTPGFKEAVALLRRLDKPIHGL